MRLREASPFFKKPVDVLDHDNCVIHHKTVEMVNAISVKLFKL